MNDMSDASRAELIRQAWKVSCGGRFSDKVLVDSVVELADEKNHVKLRQALPAVWSHLDDAGSPAEWLVATGLDGEAIAAMNSTIGAGLPQPGKKAGLHGYALRPQDFPALLFLSLVAARLATPYEGGGPHRKVRAQFWYAPELAIIVMRCLPPKLDLLAVEQTLRYIMQAPEGSRDGSIGFQTSMLGWPDGGPFNIGESPTDGYLTQGLAQFVLPEDPKNDK